jgi:hypothetical protein
MGKRMDALWRILAFIWITLVGYVAGTIILLVAIVWGIIDISWQLIVGTDGLDAMSTPAQIVENTLNWVAGQNIYALTGGGDGEFRALPSLS